MAENADPSEIMKFAALVAHQTKSPIATVVSLLKALEGGFAGPVSAAQQDLIARAVARCEQSIETARRMITIASALAGGGAEGAGPTDLAAAVRARQVRWAQEAYRSRAGLVVEIDADPAWVRGADAALGEVADALVSNALKYTPDHGRVRVQVAREADGAIRLSVADSGVGIAPTDREAVFEPFFRAPAVRRSARPGTGLGLTFVKAVAESVGGAVRADQADLGGAEIIVNLPPAEAPEPDKTRIPAMSKAFKVVIVGGVAAGPKVASKVIRLMPDAEVTVIDRGKVLSYAGCGLPYYISGVVTDQAELISTPAGVVRDPIFFQKVKNVRVMDQTEAIEIDRAAKRVRIRPPDGGEEAWLEYDKLVLATGATPVVPDLPGMDLPNIFTLHGVRDAEGIKSLLAQGKARDVVIVGGGLIGVEATEAIVQAGCRVTIVEMLPQILRILDWEIAHLVEHHLESRGVKVLTGTRVESFVGNGALKEVVTTAGTIPADMAILGIGVRPSVSLAEAAGIEIGPTGAIRVDDRMQTSDADIYAAGDCAESVDLLTGKPCYVPLGSTAIKQGRVAAVNLCGGHDVFPGVLGSTVCKVFDFCVARTGLTEAAAREAGYDPVVALAPAPDKAHFMPTANPLLLKLVADAKTRRLLGAQATGPGVGDKRIDVAAMAITAGMTVDQLANADLTYAPPYSPAMDNIITAANVARNKLDGHMNGVSAMEVRRMLQAGGDVVFLDVRTPGEYEQIRLPNSTLIPLGALRGRLGELPRDKPIVTFGALSLRGYEAALILRAAGFADVRVLDGGIAMWPFEKLQ